MDNITPLDSISEIKDKLINAGLKFYTDELNGAELKCYPHYNNNFGFFLVEVEDTKTILLKGMHSDNTRYIKGRPDIDNNQWAEISDTLAKAEMVTGAYLEMQLILTDSECFIKDVKYAENIKTADEKRDYKIPRPLAANEYSEPKNRMYDEEIILSSGFFGYMFPNVLSTFTSSIFEEITDILNPIFASCNLKTSSPTIVNLYGRLYVNMTGYEAMMKTIGLNKSLYRSLFSPHLYMKMKKYKKAGIMKYYFPVQYDEINELVADIKANVDKMALNTFTEKSFLDYFVKMSVVYEYITIMLIEYTSKLMAYFKDLSQILNAVFKSRENSIFYSSEEYELPEFLDFSSNMIKVTFDIKKENTNIKNHIKSVSFFKRGKVKKNIKNIHKLLDMRDELYLTIVKFITKTKEGLINTGKYAVNKGTISNIEDIFFMEYDEVRRVSSNSFFTDIKELINFRKWRNMRYSAQNVPPEIYGYDLSDTPYIAEEMVVKFLNQEEPFNCYGLNKVSCSGVVTNNLKESDYSNKIVTAYNLSIPKLNNYINSAGLLVENIFPYSLAAEYAVLNNIPLWTGVRFSSEILNNKLVKIENSKLVKVDE